MSEQKKAAPVYLQIREDGKVWAVLEDGTPLAHQGGVDTSSSAMKGGVQAVITLQSAGWLPSLDPEQADRWRKICSDLYRALDAFISTEGDFQPVARGMQDLLVFGEDINAALTLLREHKEALGEGKGDE